METRPLYTCITCAVGFREADLQRDHYKTDWHRYNLKRKVAELEAVSLAQFNSRLEKREQQIRELSGEVEEPTGYCVACRKSFSSQMAYQNHLKSKKHQQMATVFEERSDKNELEQNRRNRKLALEEELKKQQLDEEDMEEVDSDEWEDDDFGDEEDPVAVMDCLFCGHTSANSENNIVHMSEAHSFFLPDTEYIVDLEGLLGYLGAKMGQGHMCLWCNERSKRFRNLAALRKHTNDKGHYKMYHEGNALAEYADFYDYSSSYPEEEKPMDGDDEEVDENRLDDTGYELVLPSGAKIGHRSLMRYYRQNLNPERAVVVNKTMGKVLAHYHSKGWKSLPKAEAKTKARDIRYMRKVQAKQWLKIGQSANNQKYWRDPTM